MSHEYTSEYARQYIEGTLLAPYTCYKNKTIAEIIHVLGGSLVWDLGGNVSGLIRRAGSLRVQLEAAGIVYRSLDIVPEYFDSDFARQLGVGENELFSSVCGVVGDLQHLPLATSSVSTVVSADVIEHIPDPRLAFSEINRVLSSDGFGILVLPSLYKLDAINAPHVEARRYSSHISKCSLNQWMDMIEQGGLSIDSQNSRALGILSGLLYLAWLDPQFVPVKEGEQASEIFSESARLFREVKKIVASFDVETDEVIRKDGTLVNQLKQLVKDGEVKQLLIKIRQILSPYLTTDQMKKFQVFIERVHASNFDPESFARLKVAAGMSSDFFMANSVILVVRKSQASK